MLSDQGVLVLEGLDEFVYGHATWIICRFACCRYLGSQAWDELFATNSPSDRVKLILSYVTLSMSGRLAITLCSRSLRIPSPQRMYCVEMGLSTCYSCHGRSPDRRSLAIDCLTLALVVDFQVVINTLLTYHIAIGMLCDNMVATPFFDAI